MDQPLNQPISPRPSRAGTPLTAAIPAGSGDSAVNAGSGSAAGAVLPAPAISTQLAAPSNPGSASGEPAQAATAPPALLAILPSGFLTYKPVGSRFESIAAETLNNAGTSDDGFDDMMDPVVSALGEDQPALSSLAGDLTDADFTPGEFTATTHAPISADIDSFIATGDSASTDTATAFGSSAPAVQPAAAPGAAVPFSNVPGHPQGGLFDEDGNFIDWWNVDPGDESTITVIPRGM